MTRKVANTKDDPTVPFVTLALKGTDYKLAYSFNALALAERAMLWASLLKAQPKMTLEDAGDLLSSPLDCNLALTAIADAWTASMPKPETVDPNV